MVLDRSRPFTVYRDDILAYPIHRDMVKDLKFSRIWSCGKFNSQQVDKDHVVAGWGCAGTACLRPQTFLAAGSPDSLT